MCIGPSNPTARPFRWGEIGMYLIRRIGYKLSGSPDIETSGLQTGACYFTPGQCGIYICYQRAPKGGLRMYSLGVCHILTLLDF